MPDYWDYTPPFTDTPPAWDEVPAEDRDRVLYAWLEHAIDYGPNSIACDILTRRPDWVNTFRVPDQDYDYCPLEAAVAAANAEMVAWLLDHGADPVSGNEPLCIVARRLRQKPVNESYIALSASFAAMREKYTATLRIGKMLLDRGVSPDQPCQMHGTTPREKFFAVAQEDLVQFILNHQ